MRGCLTAPRLLQQHQQGFEVDVSQLLRATTAAAAVVQHCGMRVKTDLGAERGKKRERNEGERFTALIIGRNLRISIFQDRAQGGEKVLK